jgi:hypothetical protein
MQRSSLSQRSLNGLDEFTGRFERHHMANARHDAHRVRSRQKERRALGHVEGNLEVTLAPHEVDRGFEVGEFRLVALVHAGDEHVAQQPLRSAIVA